MQQGRELWVDLAGSSSRAPVGKTSLAYGYDGDGNLVSSSDGNKAVETLLWDSSFALPQLAVERDATGATLRDYLYGAGPIGLLAPQAHGQNTEGFYGSDAVSSVIDLTGTGSGKKQTLASYDWGPYGQGGLTKKSAKDLGNPLGYTGAYTDPTTGLVDLRARQYDPATGRFLTPDPLGPLGVGSYAYVGDNPLAYVDPSGLHRGPSCGWNLLCHLGHVTVSCAGNPLCNGGLWVASIASDNEEVALEADAGAAAGEGGSSLGAVLRQFWSDETGTVGGGRFTEDQDALIQLARDAKRRGGVTPGEAETLGQWADEYGLPWRGPEAHPGRGFGSEPHIHIGPINHIPVG